MGLETCITELTVAVQDLTAFLKSAAAADKPTPGDGAPAPTPGGRPPAQKPGRKETAAPAASNKSQQATQAASEQSQTLPAQTYEYDDVRLLLMDLKEKKGLTAVVELLKPFGVKENTGQPMLKQARTEDYAKIAAAIIATLKEPAVA
jgi:hypothetical protein